MADSPQQEPRTLEYRSGREDRPGVFDIILTTLAALTCFFAAFLLGFFVIAVMSFGSPGNEPRYYLIIAIPLFGGAALAAAAKGIQLLVSLFRPPEATVEPVDGAARTRRTHSDAGDP